MGTVASQVTSLTIVYTTVYSDADQNKHQSSASLAFVWGLHRDRWIPRTKGQLRGKCFHLMTSSCGGLPCSFSDLAHYNDVIISAMASQITSVSIVYSTVCSRTDKRKHQSSASPVNSPHKGLWREASMFSLICAWTCDWVNTREAGDLRHQRVHYDVTVWCLEVEV